MIESLPRRDIPPLPYSLQREPQNLPWIEDLVGELGLHTPWNKSHSERVSTVAEMTGRSVGMPEEEVELLRVSGLLHDVGKIYVPTEILNNTDPVLTQAQRAIIKEHPRKGFNLVAPHNMDVGKIIVAHHEPLQPNPYPRTVWRYEKGERNLSKIIVSLADQVDAAISERPYKPAEDPSLVQECLSKVCDPRLVSLAIGFRLALDAEPIGRVA